MKKFNILQQAAIQAGKAILSITKRGEIITKEGRGNFVTAADLASEKIIKELIQKNFPKDQILSEETTSDISDVLKVDRLWVIDPLDGTRNFRNNMQYSSVSVAYVEKGQMMFGAVYNPYTEELFSAEKGKGARVNGEKLHVGSVQRLSDAIVITDNSYKPEEIQRNLEMVLAIKPTPWTLMKGSACLEMCEVAAGRADLFFQTSLHLWDNAASFLILEESGAVITDLQGNNISFLSPQIIAGNSLLVKQFITAIKKIK